MKKKSYIPQSKQISKKLYEALQKLILQAPTWSDKEYNSYNKVRKNINKSRIA